MGCALYRSCLFVVGVVYVIERTLARGRERQRGPCRRQARAGTPKRVNCVVGGFGVFKNAKVSPCVESRRNQYEQRRIPANNYVRSEGIALAVVRQVWPGTIMPMGIYRRMNRKYKYLRKKSGRAIIKTSTTCRCRVVVARLPHRKVLQVHKESHSTTNMGHGWCVNRENRKKWNKNGYRCFSRQED